jgi:hypothetical protein
MAVDGGLRGDAKRPDSCADPSGGDVFAKFEPGAYEVVEVFTGP